VPRFLFFLTTAPTHLLALYSPILLNLELLMDRQLDDLVPEKFPSVLAPEDALGLFS